MSPTAFFAVATELPTGIPAAAASKGTGSAEAFTDVLMDAQAQDIEEVDASTTAVSAGSIRSMMLRRFSADELPPPEIEEQDPALDQAVPVVISTIAIAPTAAPPIAIPDVGIKNVSPQAGATDTTAQVSGEASGASSAIEMGTLTAFTGSGSTNLTTDVPPASSQGSTSSSNEELEQSEASPSDADTNADLTPERNEADQADARLTPAPISVESDLRVASKETAPAFDAPTPRKPAGSRASGIPHLRDASLHQELTNGIPTIGSESQDLAQEASESLSNPPVASERQQGLGSRTDAAPPVVLTALITPEPTGNAVAGEPQPVDVSIRPTTVSSKGPDYSGPQGGEAESQESEKQPIETAAHRSTSSESAHPLHEYSRMERSEPVAAPKQTTEVHRAAPVEINEPTVASSPLKRVEVRIPTADANIVVQVQDRKGAVEVTVRTSDVATAADIVGNLPELARSLGEQGFQAETWTQDVALDISRTVARERVASEPLIDLAIEPFAADRSQGSTMPESSAQMESDHEDRQRARDWEDQPDQRRRRPKDKEFEEYLW